MVSIARKNLFEDIPRFLVAQAGIMFAVSLVTIQTGIFNGVIRSTSLLVDNSRADIWVSSKRMVHLELTESILFDHVVRSRKVNGVSRAEALMTGVSRWQVPKGRLTVVKLWGFDPQGQLFVPGAVQKGSVSALQKPYTILVDRSDLRSLRMKKLGDRGEIGSLPANLVGIAQDTQSVLSSAFLFASLKTVNAYNNSRVSSRVDCKFVSGEFKCTNVYERAKDSQETNSSSLPEPQPISLNTPVSFILIKAKPGQDLQKLKQDLEAASPDTRAYTREELSQRIRDYWQKRTGIGFILGLGAVVGMIVGVAIVGQILYSSVSDHIKEFGTLKAMGASNRVIYGVIVEQSLWMAVIGYIPGMLLCWGLGNWTLATQGIVILITPVTAVGVFGVTVLMCVGSALFAIQKVSHVDPAIVFKA